MGTTKGKNAMKCPSDIVDAEDRPAFKKAWDKLTEEQQKKALHLIEKANMAERDYEVKFAEAQTAISAIDAAFVALAKHMGLRVNFFV